jgi:hypothetical protein
MKNVNVNRPSNHQDAALVWSSGLCLVLHLLDLVLHPNIRKLVTRVFEIQE